MGAFFNEATHVTYKVKDAAGATTEVTKNFLQPGLLYSGDVGKLDLISLGLALIFGTAGLPHILVRFYTVPDAKTARTSVVWAMALIGSFYIMTTFLGFGAATIVGRDFIAANGGTNMSGPLLAQRLAGDVFFAFISSIAFATILAVVAGLTISASTSFAHDFWTNVIHHGTERSKGEEVRVARVAAFVVGAVSILIAIVLGPTANVAFLVGLAFAVAASANLPVIIFSLFWKRFNTMGAVAGIATGLLASIILILLSPSFGNKNAIFPLTNPGILSIPLGFIGAYVGTMLSREPSAEEKFTELNVRANTGLGAEV
jgi:cation/acetate symporter